MFAQHSYPLAVRLLAALAIALAFVFVIASSAAQSASADGSQWMRSQPHWWDHSNGWHKPWHHRRHFHSSRPRVIIGGSGFAFSSPGLVIINRGFVHPGFVVHRRSFANPAFIVRQPSFANRGFVVRQPGFIVRQPSFVMGQPNFLFDRPDFVGKPKKFFKHRHHGHDGWKHKRWPRHSHGSGVRIIVAP